MKLTGLGILPLNDYPKASQKYSEQEILRRIIFVLSRKRLLLEIVIKMFVF